MQKNATYESLFDACVGAIDDLPKAHPIRRELQKKFENQRDEVIAKTVELLRSKVSLRAIHAYLGEERFRMALSGCQFDYRNFGKPRSKLLKSKLTNIIEAQEASKEYQERALSLVSRGKGTFWLDFEWHTTADNLKGRTAKADLRNDRGKRVSLTTVCVSQEFISRRADQNFNGSRSDSAFPRVTIVHPNLYVLSCIEEKEATIYRQITEGSLQRSEVAGVIGELGWWEFNALQWKRGTATIVEIFLSALCQANSMKLRLDKVKEAGKRLDLEAQLTFKKRRFVKLFCSFVEELQPTP